MFPQQGLLIVDESMLRAWAAVADDLPCEYVGVLQTVSDDGDAPSQWLVSIGDVQACVNRLTEVIP